MNALTTGMFIRVRADHENQARAGFDGMVMADSPEGDSMVGLVFWSDRHNHFQRCECVGTEAWDKSELDFSTAE